MTEVNQPRQRKPRRRRSATESLVSIALGLEATLVFFVTMAVFGLREVSPGVAFGGGAVLFLLLIIAAAYARFPWAIWLGWAMQAVLIALGLVLPVMYAIGAGFAAIFIYCFLTGRRLDRQNNSATA
ncbi:DUF4233 domain-containing protein [Cryobacterium sp. BB736]|uniref:DUF4233 domain-containing protein n=1 Tax=Cryobacterium sp. BB736 TaxID=2746963 RepID=UPI00351C2AD6